MLSKHLWRSKDLWLIAKPLKGLRCGARPQTVQTQVKNIKNSNMPPNEFLGFSLAPSDEVQHIFKCKSLTTIGSVQQTG